MRKIQKIVNNKKAESTPITIAIVLSILLMSCAMAEFFRLGIIVQGVRDALQSSVISVATNNYDEVYNGLREGYSGGYTLNGNSWQTSLDYYDVYGQMDSVLGTQSTGAYHAKETSDGYEYRYSNLEIHIDNTLITPGNTNTNFEADVSVSLEIPLSFGWDFVPPLEMEVKTKAAYMPKF